MRSSQKLRIAVDMDEVIADTLGKQLGLYNRRWSMNVTLADLHGKELLDISPEHQSEWLMGIFHEPGFFADIEPIPGAMQGMERLCAQYEVFIASAATQFPTSFNDKLSWLERHVPQIPRKRVIFCGDKSVLDVDYLIDDSAHHFAGLRGVGLLFDAPHNRGIDDHFRVHGWTEVEQAISLFEAKSARSCARFR